MSRLRLHYFDNTYECMVVWASLCCLGSHKLLCYHLTLHYAHVCVLFLHSSSPYKLSLKAVSHAISATIISEKKTKDVKLRVRWLPSVYLHSYGCQLLLLKGTTTGDSEVCHACCYSLFFLWEISLAFQLSICLNGNGSSLLLTQNQSKVCMDRREEGVEQHYGRN